MHRSPWIDRRARREGTAHPVQPRAARRRQRHRLPLLSHVGRGFGIRGHSADQDLHELPFAELFAKSPFLQPVRESFESGRAIEWTRVNDLPDFVHFDHSIHVQQGRRLHDVPRCRRSHAADGAGTVAADGMVSRLPPAARSVRPAAKRRVQRDLLSRRPISSSSAAAWSTSTQSSERSTSSLERATDDGRAPEFWRTLDELADDPAFRERLYNEFPIAGRSDHRSGRAARTSSS